MGPEGNTWPASRRFAIGYALAITALIINSIYTLHNFGIISNSWSAVAASQETLAGLDEVLLSVTEAETGQRGYLLDGDERYLDPYTRSHPVAAAAIDRLRSLAGRDARRPCPPPRPRAAPPAATNRCGHSPRPLRPSSPSWHRRSGSARRAASTPPSPSSGPTAASNPWTRSAA